jgi:hypothetical protein
MTPGALIAARRNLRGPIPDLIDKFSAIRNGRIPMGGISALGTLDEPEIQRLKAFSVNLSPDVQVNSNVVNSMFGGASTRAEMVFRTGFRSRVEAAPPNTVIRFVRAAQVNRNFGTTQEEHTVPGYVHYEKGLASRTVNSSTEVYVRAALMRSFNRARWSFDGPREPFVPGRGLANEDAPGTMSSDLPYAIKAEFLIVLYDAVDKRLLEVGHAAGWLGVWRRVTGAPATWNTTFQRLQL